MKPVIGISGSILINKGSSFNGYKRAYVNHDYIQSVINAGAIPLILPFNEDEEVTKMMLERVDGLILSGGHDIDPTLYNEEPLLKIGEILPERDKFDSILYKNACKLKKPIFGICRGFQLINVLNGGSLYQDLSYADFVTIRHNQVDNPSQATHSVDIENDTFLTDIFGNMTRVNSFHHQIVKDLAKDFKVVAKSKDGVIEAIEKIDDTNYIIATQWHPEMMSSTCSNTQKIFNNFVNKVKELKK